MRIPIRHPWLLPALAAAVLLAGCGDDPVTTPGGDPLIYLGVLETGGRIEEPLVLAEEGTVRIELTDVTPIFVELGVEGELPLFSLGVGLGDDSSGSCAITFGTSLLEGESLTVLVEDTMLCLLVFDDGSLPPDAVISYTVTIEDVQS